MTRLNHLKCLSAVKSTANIAFLTPAAFPGTHCPMHTALAMSTKIRGISTLVVGSNECAMYSRNIPAVSPYAGEALHWTYVLDGNEVIFGCRKGLSQAVLEMDKAGAKVILLLSTCVPEVIGEDMNALARALETQVSAKIIAVPLGNFKCLGYQPGYWQTLRAMGTLIRPAPTRRGTVNILGRSPVEDHTPIPALLSAMQEQGMYLRFLAPDASADDFIQCGDAAASLVLSPFLHPLARWMQDTLGICSVSLHDVYSPEDIAAAYEEISHTLGVKLDFSEEHARVQSLEKKFMVAMEGKSCVYANIGAAQPLPMAAYLAGLKLHPALIHMEDFYPSDAFWSKALLALGENPPICLMVHEAEDMQVINALRPDLVLGDWGGRYGCVSSVPFLMDLYGQIGYERTAQLLERILRLERV